MAQNYRHLWWQMVAKNDLTKRAAWGAEMFQLFSSAFPRDETSHLNASFKRDESRLKASSNPNNDLCERNTHDMLEDHGDPTKSCLDEAIISDLGLSHKKPPATGGQRNL